MAALTTVDGNGATRILAMSFIVDETEESYTWVLECFKDAFREAPAVIFTDSDHAMKAAIASVFPTAQHLLCIWHLSKNMVTHIKAACGSNTGLWRRMQDLWWAIAQQSDTQARETFDTDWARLSAMLEESTLAGKAVESARKWLAKMADERERWAARWTWQHYSMGIHSTQRHESIHAAVSPWLRANTRLTDVVRKVEAYDRNVASSVATRDVRFWRRLDECSARVRAHPDAVKLAEHISPFALLLWQAQLEQAAHYRVAETPEAGIFRVTRPAPAGPSAPAVAADVDDADLGLDSPTFTWDFHVTTADS